MTDTNGAETPRYLREFPEIGDLGITLGEGWEDESMRGGDLCPTFVHRHLGLYLHVDHAQPLQRAVEGAHRFYLCETVGGNVGSDFFDPQGEWHGTQRVDQDFCVNHSRDLLHTDHADVVLAYVEARHNPAVRYAHTGMLMPGDRVNVDNPRFRGTGTVVKPSDHPSHLVYWPATGFMVCVRSDDSGDESLYEVRSVERVDSPRE
jgi:hypothetical protein